MKVFFNKYTLIVLLSIPVIIAGFPYSRDIHRTADVVEKELFPVEYSLGTSQAKYVDVQKIALMDSSENLDSFLEKLADIKRGRERKISVLHIGDSHVQAGFWTGTVRDLLQQEFGDAGPGLIVPLKMVGTNEPKWYSISSDFPYENGYLGRNKENGDPGWTGVSVKGKTSVTNFKIWSKKPFEKITALHHPQAPGLDVPDRLHSGYHCIEEDGESHTIYILSQPTDSLELWAFNTPYYNRPDYYGFILENGQPGILYNSVGINGAAFDHFTNRSDILEGAANVLSPDLIIVSLGTNNCFGSNFREDVLQKAVSSFLDRLKNSYPDAAVILTSPMESCRRTTVRGKRVYSPNKNIKTAGEIIRKEAEAHGYAFFDLYEAAGGEKSSLMWNQNGLMSRDHIHLTEAGYILTGEMLYRAIINSYNNYISPHDAD